MDEKTKENLLKVLTLNCQGLGDKNKRKDVFNNLKSKNCNIYMLQDTHFTKEDENIIKTQWGYEVFFSSFKSNARGVATLVNNNCEFKSLNVIQDDSGNYLILDVEIEDIPFILINIYGPNNDRPQFYSELKSKIEDIYTSQHIILGGDFNLILDKDLDSMNYKNLNNPKARTEVLKLIDTFNLKDVFREQCPFLKRYTWRKKNPIKQARLDFFLISESLQTMSPCIKHENSYRSDHSPVLFQCKLNEFIKGKGFWKFNNSLLTDKDYINIIKKLLNNIICQYSCHVYNKESISTIRNEDLCLTINDQLFLDTLLMEIRGKTISYASYKKKKQNQRKLKLEKEITEIEQNLTQNTIDELNEKQNELEQIRSNILKGQCIRSKAKWIEEGEKPTKYFLSLESRNYISKQIPRIQKDDGSIITDQFKILNEIKMFYENLYRKRETIYTEDFRLKLNKFNVTKLTKEESDSLEGPINNTEVYNFLKKMKNDKSPGPDGFTCEFFKFFWKDIGVFVTRAINNSYEIGQFSDHNKLGIITCIPKAGKPKQYLKNWRPITLLNVVYKIASGCIAERIKVHLDKLINTDQTGFIKGRFIGENIRLIYDIIQYTDYKQIPGLLMLIDFEKAFDTISWEFINQTLDFFNFGNKLKNGLIHFIKE